MTASASDVLGQKTWSMPPIDTQSVAQEDNHLALIDLLVVIISMAVLSPDVGVRLAARFKLKID